MSDKGIIVVVSGFSGAGKGTLMKRLVSEYDGYALSVSMTTRSPREGEVHGREYFFVSKEEFKNQIATGGLVEHTCYCDNYYGTPRSYLEEQMAAGRDVILEIEVEGGHQIRELYPEALLVFVTPPSIDELKKRLSGRGTETAGQIEKRIQRAKEEIESVDDYDLLIINDDLDEALKDLHDAIRTAHFAVNRSAAVIKRLKEELN